MEACWIVSSSTTWKLQPCNRQKQQPIARQPQPLQAITAIRTNDNAPLLQCQAGACMPPTAPYILPWAHIQCPHALCTHTTRPGEHQVLVPGASVAVRMPLTTYTVCPDESLSTCGDQPAHQCPQPALMLACLLKSNAGLALSPQQRGAGAAWSAVHLSAGPWHHAYTQCAMLLMQPCSCTYLLQAGNCLRCHHRNGCMSRHGATCTLRMRGQPWLTTGMGAGRDCMAAAALGHLPADPFNICLEASFSRCSISRWCCLYRQ